MSTNLFIAVLVLILLAILGLYGLIDRWSRRHKRGPAFAVFELGGDKLDPKSLLSRIKPPFTLEAAVKQFGKAATLYIVVPRAKAKKVAEELGVKEIADYDLYSAGGAHIGPGITKKKFAKF